MLKLIYQFIILFLFSSALVAEEINIETELEPISLQLKWFHQFQFAGYYAAKEQGYYAEAGLDVTFIQRSPNINVVNQVVSGKAQYGIEDTGIIVHYANGKPIKALAAIFQHNPFVFISKQSSGIVSPYEMVGKRIMFDVKKGVGAEELPLRALLLETGISKDQYSHFGTSFDKSDLIKDKTDVISGYITDAPFYFKERGVKVNIINPLNYGVDFYGDLLFTSKQELESHPERAERFRQASLKGWKYALKHPEEIIQLIKDKYQSKLSLDLLRYEAKQVHKLILPDSIPIGEIKTSRLKQAATIYARLKLAPELSEQAIYNFINLQQVSTKLSEEEKSWLKKHPILSFTGDPAWLPYEAFDEEGNYIGIVADHLKKIEAFTGIQFKIIPTNSWTESVELAKQNKVAVISETVDSNLKTVMNFSKPYLSSPIVIVMKKDALFVDNISQIAHNKIALIKEYGYVQSITDKYPDIEYIWFDTIEDALTAVSTGQVDALFSTLAHSIYKISKMGLSNVRIVGKTEFTNDLAFGIKKELAPLVPIFNRAIDSINEIEKRKIAAKWGEEKYQEKTDYWLIIQISAVLLFILGLFVFWNRKLAHEINQRKKTEEKLKLAATVYEHTNQAMMVIDHSNTIIAVNPSFTEMTGYTFDDALGKNPKFLQSEQYGDLFNEMWTSLYSTGSWQGEVWNVRKNGEEYAAWLTISTIFNDDNSVSQRVGLFSDITDKKLADEQVWKQANFDNLTQLPNRSMFNDRLSQDIKASIRNGKSLALFFMDLDHFKDVNDALGHDKGDMLLVQAASRVSDCVRDSDTVARLGGDEFTVILSDLDDSIHVERVAEDIIQSLSLPFTLDLDEAYVSVSIGIAFFPEDANSTENLIKNADQAMYLAKENGRNQFSFFTQTMQLALQNRHKLMHDLRNALEQEQFQLYYQPIIDLQSEHIYKAEALLRWLHPEKGLIYPTEFIPLAEESGIIVEIGNWVFQQAALQAKHWQTKYNSNFQISINKSPIQFRSLADYLDWMEYLDDFEIDGKSIIIEITEGLLIDTSEIVVKQLLTYRDKGIQVAIDDFGTGYSALSYLNKFDIDYLKIDRSFICDLEAGSNEMVLCEAIIVMAHKLGLKVIAEGIETKQQEQLLKAAGCDYGQGFLYSKPVPIKAFEKLLKQTDIDKSNTTL